MKIKELVTEYKKNRKSPKFNIKPRTGHAPTQTGAGEHKDKKKAQKQGDEKHKGKMHEAYGRPNFEVDGWKYITDVEEEEDNRKIFHTALDPNGKRYDINFTPYGQMTAKTFQLWIKLGAPSRLGNFGSFDNEDIVKAAEIHGIANLDPMMANAGKKEGFVDASNMSRRDVQRLGHEDDDTPEQYGVFINGKLWKKFATRDEANRVSLAIERKHGKPTTVRSV
jgi:hypothetical protein